LLGTALLICMQNVGALRMLGQCSTRCPAWCGLLECYNIGTCEMCTRAESIGTISTNATGTSAANACHFCWCAECMCQ
jgi:hypothetical protein